MGSKEGFIKRGLTIASFNQDGILSGCKEVFTTAPIQSTIPFLAAFYEPGRAGIQQACGNPHFSKDRDPIIRLQQLKFTHSHRGSRGHSCTYRSCNSYSIHVRADLSDFAREVLCKFFTGSNGVGLHRLLYLMASM